MANNTGLLKDYLSLSPEEQSKVDISKFGVLKDYHALPDEEKDKLHKSLGIVVEKKSPSQPVSSDTPEPSQALLQSSVIAAPKATGQPAQSSPIGGLETLAPEQAEPVTANPAINPVSSDNIGKSITNPEIPSENTTIDYISNSIKRGINQGKTANLITAFKGGKGITKEEIKELADIQKDNESLVSSPEYQQYNQSKTWQEGLSNFVKSPVKILSELTGESLSALATHGASRMALGAGEGAIAGTIVPGIGTAAGAGVGVLAGMGASSANLEYSGKILESLQEAGIDVQDPKSLESGFSNEEMMDKARDIAMKKAVPVALFDLVSGGVAGKIASKPAKNIVGKAAQWAGELGVQMGLGMGGEAAGQVSEKGGVYDPTAVLSEGLGELGGGAGEVLTGQSIENNLQKQNDTEQADTTTTQENPAADSVPDMGTPEKEVQETEPVQDKPTSETETSDILNLPVEEVEKKAEELKEQIKSGDIDLLTNDLSGTKESTTTEENVGIDENNTTQAEQIPGEVSSSESVVDNPKEKRLKVAERVLDSPETDPDIKKGLLEQGIDYVPVSTDITEKQASDYISGVGQEKAYETINSSDKNISPSVKGEIARQLYSEYQSLYKSTGDNFYLQRAVNATIKGAEVYNEAGRTVNAAKLWKQMLSDTPEGFLVEQKKKVKQNVDKALGDQVKVIDDAKVSVDELIKNSWDDIVASDSFKKMIGEMSNKEAFQVEKSSEAQTSKIKKKRIDDFFDNLKIDIKKDQLYDATYVLPAETWNTAMDILKTAIKAGIDVQAAIQSAVDHIKEKQAGKSWDEAGFRKDMSAKLTKISSSSDKITKQDIRKAVDPDKIQDIARRHFTEINKSRETLTEKILSETGITGEAATKLAEDIKNMFGEMVKKNQEQILSKTASSKDFSSGKKKRFVEDLIQELNMGSLENDQFRELYAKQLGVNVLSKADEQRILDLSKKIKDSEDAAQTLEDDFTKENKADYEKKKKIAEEAFDELNEIVGKKMDVADTLSTMLQGNLLTPLSIITNIYSNAILQPLRFATFSIASGIDYLASKATGTASEFDWGARQKGYFKGAAQGSKIGSEQLFTGQTTEQTVNQELNKGFKPMRQWALAKDAWKGGDKTLAMKKYMHALFGTTPEVMFRLLNLGDKPFSEAAKYAKAYEIGKKKSLEGEALEKFIMFPDEKSKQDIEDTGQKATFQQNEGLAKVGQNIVKAIYDGIEAIPSETNTTKSIKVALKVLMKTQLPFVKTPLNIISESIDYAIPPVSLAKGIYQLNKGDKQAGLTNISKSVVGSMIGLLSVELFKKGILSPSAGEDDKERSIQYQEMPPRGLNMSALFRMLDGEDTEAQKDDIWIDYSKMGPVGTIFNINANNQERLRKAKQQDSDTEKLLSLLSLSNIVALAGISMEQSFLQGTNQLLNAIQEGGNKLDKWAVNTTMAISNITIPNTVYAASRSVNDNMPELNDDGYFNRLNNRVKSSFFGGDNLPAKINMWGDPIKQTPDYRNKFIYNFLDVTKFKELRKDEMSYQIYKLYRDTDNDDVIPGRPNGGRKTMDIGGKTYKMTPKQYEEYATVVGKRRKRLAESLVSNPKWNSISDENKIKLLKHAYESATSGPNRKIKKILKQTTPIS